MIAQAAMSVDPRVTYGQLVARVKTDYRKVATMMLNGDQYSDPFLQGGIDFLVNSIEGRLPEPGFLPRTAEFDAYRFGWNSVQGIYTSLYLSCDQSNNDLLETISASL